MMAENADAALAQRLEQLTGTDGACCATDLAREADALVDDAFRAASLRAKALCDERRLLAARLIKARGEMCGCELQAALRVSHATVSHHMACLQTAGLVVSERRGKWVYYSLAPKAAHHVP